jgi:hypothetical protein
MEQRNFFAELKRRNVYKAAVAYAVAARQANQSEAATEYGFRIVSAAARSPARKTLCFGRSH